MEAKDWWKLTRKCVEIPFSAFCNKEKIVISCRLAPLSVHVPARTTQLTVMMVARVPDAYNPFTL